MVDASDVFWQHNAKTLQRLTVEGLKSIRDSISLEIRPLTVLCGTNSSGKTSALQALLLLKQTAESTYDGGPLLLSGDQVYFTETRQLLWSGNPAPSQHFRVRCDLTDVHFELTFDVDEEGLPRIVKAEGLGARWPDGDDLELTASRMEIKAIDLGPRFPASQTICKSAWIAPWIHVAGLRGVPSRTYPVTGTGPFFPGRFSPYVASIVARWRSAADPRVEVLGAWLARLGLSDRIDANRANSAALEVRVARTMGGDQMVSLVDVGFGVSQVLPVLVALLAATSDHLVIVEQPELHLHPRAQAALADILVEASKNGRRIIIETHSAILLRRLQTLVAKDELPPEELALHWFSRDAEGVTRVDTVQLDERGAYGDWPEDFSEVEAEVDGAYIDAATAKL
ncbi:MAG: AAA family ATPase [Myxococcales bacterium]|nr:AAA family ATPase [Myxococcales bacterium]